MIDDFGVMGQVIHVNAQSATIILISDPEHAIPVQFVRSGTRSVAFGRGSTRQLELRYLPATADIMVDDELVTSGLGGRFPPNYPVARVTSISEDRIRGFVSVIAEPKARLDSSREVLVIKPRLVKSSRLRYLVIYASLVVALILMILPLPDWAQMYRPNWIALVLIYWSMALPNRVGLWFAFFSGIILDTSLGTLLGQHTLALVVVIFFNLNFYQRIRVLALAQQALYVFLLLLINQVVVAWVEGILGRPTPLLGLFRRTAGGDDDLALGIRDSA